MCARRVLATITMTLLTIASPAIARQTPRHITELAAGVYYIEHEDPGDGNASGNSLVVIGSRQVLVVDACYLPSVAREDIAQIRQWTDKPVAFVVNTHFHNDHNFGNRTYVDAFPGVTIIAHAETKKDMDRFGPGSADRLERGIPQLQQMLDSGRTSSGKQLTPAQIVDVRAALSQQRDEVKDLRSSAYQSPTLTFTDSLTIDLGGRVVRVLFLGRGNTAGDAVVYLPQERIVETGDLVVNPIPYVYDGYPSEWVTTLERLQALGAQTYVPGHGPVMHDASYVTLVHDLMQSAVTQLNQALMPVGPAMFHSVDDVRGHIDLTPFRQRFAGSHQDIAAAFDDMANDLIKAAFDEARLR
jgi:cyclase